MLHDGMHQELTTFERMLLHEWLQLDSGVLEVDQS